VFGQLLLILQDLPLIGEDFALVSDDRKLVLERRWCHCPMGEEVDFAGAKRD
jgi:hypothetical protein